MENIRATHIILARNGLRKEMKEAKEDLKIGIFLILYFHYSFGFFYCPLQTVVTVIVFGILFLFLEIL